MLAIQRNIRSLLIGRLVVVTTLLVAAIVIQLSTVEFLPLEPFYLLIFATFVLSLFYLLLFRWDAHYKFQAYLQICFDLVLITGLVFISGGLNGNLYFLYVFVIAAASLVLGSRASYLAAAFSAILFGALADGMFYGLIHYFREDQARELSAGMVLYTIFLAWALYFVIAVLVNYLSQSLGKARAALVQAQKDLEIKERQAAAGRMSAMVAHEIRNPLAAIAGSVQVLKSELTLTGEQAGLMDIVLKESKRASQTIEQFLNLAAPGTEVFATFDLAETLRETLTMLRMSGEIDDRVVIRGDLNGDRLIFYGNPSQFKQIFWNLIRNSLRAMPHGGVLTLEVRPWDKGQVRLRFADTGKGMTPEELKRIFEPFYTRFEGGQGLGMVVVQKIVDDYQGSIQVHSAPESGTEVVITLPHRTGINPRE